MHTIVKRTFMRIKSPYTPDAIQLRQAIFQFSKVNKTMYEGKLQEILTQNDSKYYRASKYLDNLNQVQSYLSLKIKKSRHVAESRPVCLDLYALILFSIYVVVFIK